MLDALVVSWGYSQSVSGHTGFDAYTGSTLFERRQQWQGTRDIAAFLSVPAAIQFQEKHGWEGVRRQCHDLLVETKNKIRAMTGLAAISEDRDFGKMAAIPVPAMDAYKLKNTLFDCFRIEIPVTTHADRLFVRLSLQGYNTPEDCEALVRALAEIYGFAA